MARVYSWQVQDSPRVYAYIVNPDNLKEAYVGYELTGNNLNTVQEWAAKCSDVEYEAHFNKMLALCESKNYNVTFDAVEAYMDVKASCDNLRGPSGRGIKEVKESHVADGKTYYQIIYDDGDTDMFSVTNGKDGRDGKDGAKGDVGVSTKTLTLYASGSGLGENGENGTPSRPSGGKYDFENRKLVDFYDKNGNNIWKENDTDLSAPVFISTANVYSTDNDEIVWSKPLRITGDDGQPGTDGISTEFIYMLTNYRPNRPEISENYLSNFVIQSSNEFNFRFFFS